MSLPTVKELYKKRRATLSKIEREFVIKGAIDEGDALLALFNDPAVPTKLGDWDRVTNEFEVEEADADIYVGKAVWTPPGLSQVITDFNISFDISGQTINVKRGLETISKTRCDSGTAQLDFGGRINVTGWGPDATVEGVDVSVPAMTFKLDCTFQKDSVNDSYIQTLRHLVGRQNDSAFKGFDANELLLTQVSGDRRNQDDWHMQFGFAVSENQSGITIGGGNGIKKAGWDYLWVYYSPNHDETDGFVLPKPVQANVERVYPLGNFNTLGVP